MNKYVRLLGRTYIRTCRSYVHTPRDFTNGASLSVTFTTAHLYGNVYMRVGVARALADSSNFGLLEKQSSQKWDIPYIGRRWTAVQNLTVLTLSSAKKSVTVQTNTKIVTDISTLCLSACVDKQFISYTTQACSLRHSLMRASSITVCCSKCYMSIIHCFSSLISRILYWTMLHPFPDFVIIGFRSELLRWPYILHDEFWGFTRNTPLKSVAIVIFKFHWVW